MLKILALIVIPLVIMGVIISRKKQLEEVHGEDELVLKKVIKNDGRAFILVLILTTYFLTKEITNPWEIVVGVLGQVAIFVIMTLITQIQCKEHFRK